MISSERLLNVVDVEATCWAEGAPTGQVSEIIEIGLVVVDTESLGRVERQRFLVRPERSTVSDFCTQLTGLTASDVASGMTFKEACWRLAVDHEAGRRPWTSWGDYDRKQFERQCGGPGIRDPWGWRHFNAKTIFTEAYGLRRRPGMAQALEIAGLPLEGHHHRGADDAWNIAALVLQLMERGVWPATPPR
jgi:inhibitor of KinA sporulation pathway (predicted exonuclease)